MWLLVLAGLLAIAVVIYLSRPDTETPKPEPEPALPEVPRMIPPNTGTKLGDPVPFTPEPVTDPEKAKGMLEYPDGTLVEPLNGVENPQRVKWKQIYKFSPIVAKERTSWEGIGEIEWYVHADGTRSTTFMTFVDGVRRPVTMVAHAEPEETGTVHRPETVEDKAKKEAKGPDK